MENISIDSVIKQLAVNRRSAATDGWRLTTGRLIACLGRVSLRDISDRSMARRIRDCRSFIKMRRTHWGK